MLQKEKMLKVLCFLPACMLAWVFAGSMAFADTATETLREESVGASIVFSTNAYNDASTENLGIEIEEVTEEIDSPDLVMTVGTSVLNVRSGPSLDYEIVGKMYRDCGGTVVEREDGWSKIKSGDVEGWCSDEYLIFGDEAVALAKDVASMTAVIKANACCVRTEASDDSELLGYTTANTEFELIYEVEDSDWVCIAYGDYDGFVHSEYVTVEYNIDHGETIEVVNARKAAERALKNSAAYKKQVIKNDHDDLRLLAALIWCEARGESYEGMVAVGAVVMNRVNSGAYPDTIFDVIFASGQFSPAQSGSLFRAYANNANSICYQAAQEAMNGVSPVGSVTHFRRKGTKEGIIIGNHVFY